MNNTDHIIQKDTRCDECDNEMPKGYLAVEDSDTGELYCSYTCWEVAKQEESDSAEISAVDMS